MRRYARIHSILIALLAVATAASADLLNESFGGYKFGDELPFGEEDIRQIEAHVLAQQPLVSSSPGIKAAGASRNVRLIDDAYVIYYPHSESGGIKEAFQVSCSRHATVKTWTCEDVEIRRYLSLDSQEFEVRITGPIESLAAISLIEAARKALPQRAEDGLVEPMTAIMVLPYRDGYLSTWHNVEGDGSLTMQARLREGGDPSEPKDWLAKSYEPDQ